MSVMPELAPDAFETARGPKSWTMELLNQTTHGQLSAKPSEKRSCIRYPFSPAVEAMDIGADTRILGRLSDISRNGCYVDTISPFGKGSEVKLTITSDNLSFETCAKVVYSNVGMGMGLLFTTAEPGQLQVLGKWLSELSGGKVVEQGAPNPSLQLETAKNTDPELRKIVTDLIALLNGKNILNDSEGMTLLRRLSK